MSSETITWWNVAAADGLAWAWRAGLASLAVLAALLVARPLMKRRLSAHAASWLWLLPLVPLVAPPVAVAGWVDPFPALPVELAARASGSSEPGVGSTRAAADDAASRSAALDGGTAAGDRAPATGEASNDELDGERVFVPGGAATAGADALAADRSRFALDGVDGEVNGGVRGPTDGAGSPLTPPTRATVQLEPATVGVLAWLAIALAGVALVLLRLARTAALVRRATGRPDDALAARFDTLARHAGLDRRVGLRLTNELASPATTGFLRATVLVPTPLATELDAAALDWVLRHELAHVRRRDVLVSTLVQLVRALWPLHPTVWLAPLFAERERELACDEAALAREPRADGPRAARTLLHVLERRRSSRPLATGAVPLAHPESLERRRIMKLLDPAVRASRGLSPFSALGLVLTAVGLLTSGLRPLDGQDTVAPQPEAAGVAATEVQEVAAAPPALDGTTPTPRSPVVQEHRHAPHVEPEPQTPDRHTVVASALRYLIANQADDGRWHASVLPNGTGAGEFDDVGVTANAILALLDAPAGFEIDGRERALERAIAWLGSLQSAETGAFALPEHSSYSNSGHARALTAWIAYHTNSAGTPDSDAWLANVRSAVAFCEASRNPYQGWRFDYPPVGDNDAVVTSWMLSALAAAESVGIEVGREVRRGGFDMLAQYYDPLTGRVGYNGRGVPTSRIWGKNEGFPAELVEFPTTTAVCAHLDWGDALIDSDALIESVTLVASKPPLWSRGEGTIDSYYWAFGTRALQPLGGALAERWNSKLESALLEHFDRDSDGRVYWAAVDAWHSPGSEVAMTAMCVLALQAIEEPGSDH